MTWVVDPLGAFKAWNARRRHRARVAKLRRLECKLVAAEAAIHLLERTNYNSATGRNELHFLDHDKLYALVKRRAVLKKHIHYCKHDIFEEVS